VAEAPTIRQWPCGVVGTRLKGVRRHRGTAQYPNGLSRCRTENLFPKTGFLPSFLASGWIYPAIRGPPWMASWQKEGSMITLFNADCLPAMREMPDKAFGK